jgi:phenylalanyl-tRNA synthetase alpha chain
MKQDMEHLAEQALQEISSAENGDQLEHIRVTYLGRKGRLTLMLRQVGQLPVKERPSAGQMANQVKVRLEKALEEKLEDMAAVSGKPQDTLDITLPGRRPWVGRCHPLTQATREIVDIFRSLGFGIALGPEVETDYYNFGALNFPPDHPARDMQDTYYLGPEILLRTHTSPVQIRVMEGQEPPVRVVVPGRVYRNEEINARSYTVFYQVEGLAVDRGITFGDLKGILTSFVEQFFGPRTRLRFRPHFFPFTEPSAEVDISCFLCGGKGCRVCKRTGWLEILGAGMVDPAVLQAVDYDPQVYSGFAFGMGVDRIAMLRYGINDIRLFYENDLRFLRQF